MDEDMETWTRTWKHGQRHENMEEDGHGNIDKDMQTRTRACRHGGIEIKYWGKAKVNGNRKTKTRRPGIFLDPFTVCSSFKRKFVISLFVDKEIIGSHPFAN
jgi:hypothetical protein